MQKWSGPLTNDTYAVLLFPRNLFMSSSKIFMSSEIPIIDNSTYSSVASSFFCRSIVNVALSILAVQEQSVLNEHYNRLNFGVEDVGNVLSRTKESVACSFPLLKIFCRSGAKRRAMGASFLWGKFNSDRVGLPLNSQRMEPAIMHGWHR